MQPHQKQACLAIMKDLQHPRYQEKVVFFSTPVIEWFDLETDIGAAGWKEYASEIKEPRDLGTITKKLEADGYPSIASFNADVTLCFNNAKNYNRLRNKTIFDYAVAMLKAFQNKMQKLIASAVSETEVPPSKHVSINASSSSNSSTPKLTLSLSSKTKSTKQNLTSSTKTSNTSNTGGGGGGTRFEVGKAEAIMKVLTNLKSSSWFTQPIDTSLSLYLERIALPMDFVQIKTKIQQKQYTSNEDFGRDVRRCFGNCLVYNYQLLDPDLTLRKQIQIIRKDTKVVLFRFEEEWLKHFGYRGISPCLPELKDVLYAIEEGLRVMSTFMTGLAAIESFMSPVALYFVNDPAHMTVYNSIISHPMDYGSILSRLIEAQYSSTAEVIQDCTLVADNCCTFYAKQNNVSLSTAKTVDGVTVDAFKVLDKITRELEKLRSKRTVPLATHVETPPFSETVTVSPPPARSSSSSVSVSTSVRKPPLVLKSSASKAAAHSSVVTSSHTSFSSSGSATKKSTPYSIKDKYLWCIKELKAHTLENGIQTCWAFNRAVDTDHYPDYFEVVSTAMDLSLMEKKINRDRYPDMFSLWKDMQLIRQNCIAYSEFKGFADMKFLADLTADIFLYLLKLVAYEVQDLESTGSNVGAGAPPPLSALLPSPEAREAILQSDSPPEVVTFYENLNKKRRLEDERAAAEEDAAVAKAREKAEAEEAALLSSPSPHAPSAFASSGHQKLKLNFKQQAPPATASAAAYDEIEDESNLHVLDSEEDLYQEDPIPQPPVTVRRAASKGSAAKKDVRSSSFVAAPAATTRGAGDIGEVRGVQLEAWELACYDLLKRISKHEFVDTTKAGKAGVVVVDFYHPVIELYPSIQEAYLAVISQPMDLSTIYTRLDMRGYLDAEDLFLKVLLIFQNSITYNSPAIEDNDYLKSVVVRCRHMIKYVTWLAHELLPLIDDTAKDDEKEREAMGSLRLSLQSVYRQERLSVIENYPILASGRECYALIRKFEIRKYNKEMCHFIYPVEVSLLADYSIHIRHPMCFETLKEKLENSFTDTGSSRGGGAGYVTYGQFLKDLRLIFKNAKTYCAVHMEVDEISRTIYDAAVMLGDLMEGWIAREFSVEVAEKVLLHKIKSEEEAAAAAKAEEARRQVEEEDEAYRKEQLEYLLKVDPIFAADQLKRQTSLSALAPRAVSGAGGSKGSLVRAEGSGLITLPSGDLASIEEMTTGAGEGIDKSLSTKRKRVIAMHDEEASESEGEEYTEEGEGEEGGSDDDEEYKDKGGGGGKRRKSKAGKRASVSEGSGSSRIRRIEDDEEGEEEDDAAGNESQQVMDVFDQYEATQEILRKHEEILQIRQQGSATVLGVGGSGGDPVSVGGAGVIREGEQTAREDNRRRTRDAVWAAFGLPRARMRRRERGESFMDDESDAMSECSDVTIASTCSSHQVFSSAGVMSPPTYLPPPAPPTGIPPASALAGDGDGVGAIQGLIEVKGEKEKKEVKEDFLVMTKSYVPNIKLTKKRKHKPNEKQAGAKAGVLSQYFTPLEELKSEIAVVPESLSECGASAGSESVADVMDVDPDRDIGADMRTNLTGQCGGQDIDHGARMSQNQPQSQGSSRAVVHRTTVAESVTAITCGDARSGVVTHRVRISQFLSVQPEDNFGHAPSTVLYSILSPPRPPSAGERSGLGGELLVPEPILQFRYPLQSVDDMDKKEGGSRKGSYLVQILLPASLVEAPPEQIPVAEQQQGQQEEQGQQPLPLPSVSSALPSNLLLASGNNLGVGVGVGIRGDASSSLGLVQSLPLFMTASSSAMPLTSFADLTTLPQSSFSSEQYQQQPLLQVQQIQQQLHLPTQQQWQHIETGVTENNLDSLPATTSTVTQSLVTNKDRDAISPPPPPLASVSPSSSCSRSRSFSSCSPSSPRCKRSRSDSLSFPPASRERERTLRKHLHSVEEMLRYVGEVEKANAARKAAAHPIQHTFKHLQLQNQNQAVRVPSSAYAQGHRLYVDIMPCRSTSSRINSRFKKKTKESVGVRIAYLNNCLQLRMTSAISIGNTYNAKQQQWGQQRVRHMAAEGGGNVRNFLSRQHGTNIYSGRGSEPDEALYLYDVQPTISHAYTHAARGTQMHGQRQKQRRQAVVVRALDSSAGAGGGLYSLRASLPSGVALSSRLVPAARGVLVSQVVEKVRLRLMASSDTGASASTAQVDEEEEREYVQVWVLVDEGEALVMELAVARLLST